MKRLLTAIAWSLAIFIVTFLVFSFTFFELHQALPDYRAWHYHNRYEFYNQLFGNGDSLATVIGVLFASVPLLWGLLQKSFGAVRESLTHHRDIKNQPNTNKVTSDIRKPLFGRLKAKDAGLLGIILACFTVVIMNAAYLNRTAKPVNVMNAPYATSTQDPLADFWDNLGTYTAGAGTNSLAQPPMAEPVQDQETVSRNLAPSRDEINLRSRHVSDQEFLDALKANAAPK